MSMNIFQKCMVLIFDYRLKGSVKILISLPRQEARLCEDIVAVLRWAE